MDQAPAPPSTPNATRIPRAVRVLSLIAVVGLSLLVGLALAEVGLRVQDSRAGRDASSYLPADTASLETGMYAPHPYMGFTLRPGFERPGTEEGKWQTSVNALGMRGPELSVAKPEGQLRILCFGGSTTFCTGATSDARAWPSLLQQVLGTIVDTDVAVGNCGVPGYSTAESLINLELRMVDLDPDLALIYHAPNDARLMQTRGFRSDYAHMRRTWAPQGLSRQEEWLVRHCRLYARLFRGTPNPTALNTMSELMFIERYKRLHLRSDKVIVDAGLQAYERNLESIVAVARAHHSVPVLQTFAASEQLEAPLNERYFEVIQRQNEVVRSLGERLGVPVVDVAARIGDRPELFDDWMHYNDAGCEAHARAVAEGLFEAGLLEPEGRRRALLRRGAD